MSDYDGLTEYRRSIILDSVSEGIKFLISYIETATEEEVDNYYMTSKVRLRTWVIQMKDRMSPN